MSDIDPGTRPDGASGLAPFVAAATSEATAEWPRKAADMVQTVVDTIHDRAVRPVMLVARAVVFGLVIAVLAITVLILASIAGLRFFDVYAFGHRVWLSYVVLGGLLSVAGLVLWSLRTPRRGAGAG